MARAEDLRLKERDRVHHIGLVVDALVLSALQRSSDTNGRLLDAAGPTSDWRLAVEQELVPRQRAPGRSLDA